MAQKAVDIPGTGDPALLAQLYEHLFDIQIAKHRNRYLSAVFPETTTYTPPTLPAHVAVQLEPVTGAPCEDEVMKVQSAMRSYDQFANASALFDPRVGLELSQHLFDIQMARYTVRANEGHVSQPGKSSSSSRTRTVEQPVATGSRTPTNTTNNAGFGADVGGFYASTRDQPEVATRDAIERSNRLAEQTNQLIERSNQIAECANQLVEKAISPAEQSHRRLNELFGRLNTHLEQSNSLAKESTKPVEKLGDALRNINKVLVGIQHAIVRNHKGNTIGALECLVNEKGETPAMSRQVGFRTYSDFLEENHPRSPVVINGVSQHFSMSTAWLGDFLRFYGIGENLFVNATTVKLKADKISAARIRLSEYLTSCLG
ncbi:putative PSDC domain protein [Rhizoctonia solani 123E]|uniref:Putative PSDC domain protein n=1 Tax=Rhizoctonia solani 123E TaxID=1423351 RepID=A0A074RSX1_9AGAM|nr:putative PSDC domain protein [Rhizoctonia solani 123E]